MATVYRDLRRPRKDGTAPFVVRYQGPDKKTYRWRSKAKSEAEAWREAADIEQTGQGRMRGPARARRWRRSCVTTRILR